MKRMMIALTACSAVAVIAYKFSATRHDAEQLEEKTPALLSPAAHVVGQLTTLESTASALLNYANPQTKALMSQFEFDVTDWGAAVREMPKNLAKADSGNLEAKRLVFAATQFCLSIYDTASSAGLAAGERTLSRADCVKSLFGEQKTDAQLHQIALLHLGDIAKSGDLNAKVLFSVQVRQTFGREVASNDRATQFELDSRALAKSYLLDAAAKGNPQANAMLAEIYLTGSGVPKDLALARGFATAAMANGEYPDLMRSLGLKN
jgi:TPR repeat protein